MARVLVTGGAGYIGSHAVHQLIEKGYQVFVLDNFTTGHLSLVHPKAHLIRADVRDEELVRNVLSQNRIDSVLHFAAFTSVEESLREPEKYYQNNFAGTVSLLRACESSDVRNLIFSSTAAVYAPLQSKMVTEDSPLDPGTPYGKSKMMSEIALKDLAATGKLKYMILRYFNVAGASLSNQYGQFGDDHSALVKRAALAAVGKIKKLSIYGTDYPTEDGTAVRDYIHVEDLAEIHIEALESLLNGGLSEIFNCGYGSGYSVRQVINTMKKVSGVDFDVEESPRRQGDLPAVIAGNSKLLQKFKWSPKRNNIEVICRSAFEWEKKQLQ